MALVPNHYPGKRVLAVDFDGTLCTDDRTYEPGATKPEVVRLVREARGRGWFVVVHSARPVSHEPVVARWLRAQGVEVDQIALGAKPPADLYLDDAGLFPTVEVMETVVAWKEHSSALAALAAGVLAGRWAEDQALVPENPDAGAPAMTDSRYLVAVPLTGGMDSTTAWGMAQEAGLPAVPFYVDCGQPYAKAELAAATEVAGQEPILITAQHLPARWKHLMPGRNATIVVEIADWLRTAGCWGELWLGNLAGETPARGGDKSARFFAVLQGLLCCQGYDLHLMHPLRGLDKTDLVHWWRERDQLDTLRRTKSCFDPDLRACGRCQTCFRKFVAFCAAGAETEGLFDREPDFSDSIAKYEPLMLQAQRDRDWSRYSPARCRDTLLAIDQIRMKGIETVGWGEERT